MIRAGFRVVFGALLLSATARGSLIGLGDSQSGSYKVLKLTEQGEVAQSTCPISGSIDPDCDPTGLSTMAVPRALFEAKVPEAPKYDPVSKATRQSIEWTRDSIQRSQAAVQRVDAKIAPLDRKLQELGRVAEHLAKEIAALRERLQDPSLDPDDRRELAAHLEKQEYAQRRTSEEISGVNRDRAPLLHERELFESAIKRDQEELESLGKTLEARSARLASQAESLKGILEDRRPVVAYENEALYVAGFFLFDPKDSPVEDALRCSAEAAFADGLGKVRARLTLSEGIHPKVIAVGGRNLELYSGATHEISIVEVPKAHWIKAGEVLSFASPRKKALVTCRDSSGIEGEKQWRHGVELDLGLIPGDTQCAGKPRRKYVFVDLYFMGRFDGKSAAEVCAAFTPYKVGYTLQSSLFDDRYLDPDSASWRLNQGVFDQAPFGPALEVTGHPVLGNGRFAWGSSEQPFVFQYVPAKANLLDFRRTSHESEMRSWVLPTICSTRLQGSYCD